MNTKVCFVVNLGWVQLPQWYRECIAAGGKQFETQPNNGQQWHFCLNQKNNNILSSWHLRTKIWLWAILSMSSWRNLSFLSFLLFLLFLLFVSFFQSIPVIFSSVRSSFCCDTPLQIRHSTCWCSLVDAWCLLMLTHSLQHHQCNSDNSASRRNKKTNYADEISRKMWKWIWATMAF